MLKGTASQTHSFMYRSIRCLYTVKNDMDIIIFQDDSSKPLTTSFYSFEWTVKVPIVLVAVLFRHGQTDK